MFFVKGIINWIEMFKKSTVGIEGNKGVAVH